jgi:hypothetical protein
MFLISCWGNKRESASQILARQHLESLLCDDSVAYWYWNSELNFNLQTGFADEMEIYALYKGLKITVFRYCKDKGYMRPICFKESWQVASDSILTFFSNIIVENSVKFKICNFNKDTLILNNSPCNRSMKIDQSSSLVRFRKKVRIINDTIRLAEYGYEEI